MRKYKVVARTKEEQEKVLASIGQSFDTKVMAWALSIGEKYYDVTLEEAIWWALPMPIDEEPIMVKYVGGNNNYGFIYKGYQMEWLRLVSEDERLDKYVFEEYEPIEWAKGV